jgi:hypothetical protein
MDEADVPSAVVHGDSESSDSRSDTDDRPITRTQSVELAAWEWRLVRCALQHASSALCGQEVDARLLGDRLHTLERRIDTQLTDGDDRQPPRTSQSPSDDESP